MNHRTIAACRTISVQVLNEITHVARRKMGLGWEDVRAFRSLTQSLLSAEPLTPETHEAVLFLAERYALSAYDAMIAAAALRANCETLWSQDVQHTMVLEGRLQFVNPFL